MRVGMAATSAGRDRGNSNRLKAGNSKNIANTELGAVEHDCFVNGSDIGRWAEMDYSEEENEEKLKGELSKKKDSQAKGNKRIRNENDDGSESEEEGQEQNKKEIHDNLIVIIRFNDKDQENMKMINPFALTKHLASKIGEILYAKVLNDGNLLVKCANEVQFEKAFKVKEIGKLKVINTRRVGARNVGGCKGVISGIPMNVGMEELKRHIKGGEIVSAQRLKVTREGVKRDSETVLIEFEGENMPKKVYLGYMSYPVRLYVPKPMRCFNCQRFGHIANYCKEKKRCARCGGEHDYGKCGTGVQPKCCNCGGSHNVAYGGCEVMRQENKIQKIRVEKRITYAEAARVSRIHDSVIIKQAELGVEEQQQSTRDKVYVDKKDLVTFIAGVINSTAEVKSKNDKIQLVVKAAVNHLGLVGLTWEEVRENLTNQSSQEATCIGL